MKANKANILEYLRSIKDELGKKGISKIALFGSFARGEENIYSDIDIAIQKQNNYLKHKTSYEYFELLNEIKSMLRKQFHRDSDIFDLDSNSAMKRNIQKESIYV